MKVLLKILLLLFLYIGFSIGSYWLIFNQGLMLGLMISFLLLVLCVAILAFSLYGIEIGHLQKIRLKSRMEVATLLILTVYFSSAIGLFAFINTLLEVKDITNKHSAVEKTDMLLSSLWNNDSTQISAGTIEKNGIVYSFTLSTEDEVEKIDQFLQQEKGRIADFYGNEDFGDLTIVFHDDFDTLSKASGYEEAMGYYDYNRQEIHIVPEDFSWDIVTLHEYSHFQSHVYAEKNKLSPTRLPLWFEEGVADYLANESIEQYELSDVEIIDFTQLDTDASFHNSYSRNFDPYIQSYLAVESLANEYGEDLLPTFLPAKMPSDFYNILETATGMKLTDFQETFLNEMIEENKVEQAKYDAAYEAIETQDYAEAEKIFADLMENATEDDLGQLAWMRTDLYLLQGQFDEAIRFMEKRLENDNSSYLIDDLTTLAELNVLIDPQKSLELIQEADAALQKDENLNFSYYDLEGYLEAYELINSALPLEGYMILLDEELLYNQTIIEKVEEKVETDFPEAS